METSKPFFLRPFRPSSSLPLYTLCSAHESLMKKKAQNSSTPKFTMKSFRGQVCDTKKASLFTTAMSLTVVAAKLKSRSPLIISRRQSIIVDKGQRRKASKVTRQDDLFPPPPLSVAKKLSTFNEAESSLSSVEGKHWPENGCAHGETTLSIQLSHFRWYSSTKLLREEKKLFTRHRWRNFPPRRLSLAGGEKNFFWGETRNFFRGMENFFSTHSLSLSRFFLLCAHLIQQLLILIVFLAIQWTDIPPTPDRSLRAISFLGGRWGAGR